MTTYDNLNIAQATLIFDSNGNTSVASGTFDLSSLAFLPNIPLIDQIEVERIFDTGFDTKFGAYSFTIADRRQMFIFPKDWYTINEQTKVLTFKDLSTIPVQTENDLYYPYSRTFTLQASVFPDLDIPVVQATSSSINGITRQYDKVYIRRKTPSINSIVTFAPGTRLTTTQLNLQFDQLKYNIQELVAKFRNEAILKYDENAVDGPFLGQGDLKMNNNYIKDVNSPAFTQAGTTITDASGLNFNADTFLVNLGTVVDGIVNGTLHKTGVNTSSSTFTGDFTATGLKLTNLADGSVASDAATIGQTTNATNLVTGTLAAERLANASIPLEKLSATRVTYTLPSSALENILASATAYGSSTDSNNNNMVYLTTDVKGRISSIGHRSMSYADLPTTTVTGTTYGSGKLLTLAINNKGIITGVSDTAISIANLPVSGVTAGTYGSASGTAAGALPRLVINDKGIVTEATSRVIEVNDLPATSVTGAGTYGVSAAGNANNMLQIVYDAKGRVTSASHRAMGTGDLPSGIPLSKLSTTNDNNYTLPTSAIGDTSIVLGKIDFAAGGTIPSANLPAIDLGNINASNRGTFVLPEDAVPLVPTVNTAASTWNTSPIKDFKVDAKGRIFDVSHRAFTDSDIGAISADKITSGILNEDRIPAPATAPTAGTVGSASNIPVITVDAKGRINTLTSAALAIANVSGVDAAVNTLIDNRAISHAGGAFYNAGTKKISNVVNPEADQDAATKKYVVDNFQSLSGFNAAALTQIQANAPFWDSTNNRFTALRSSNNQNIFGVATPTVDSHAANKLYVDTTVANYQTISGLAAAVVTPIQSNAVYWDGTNFTAFKSGANKKIRGVDTPSDNSDAVPLGYFNSNALVKIGSEITASNAFISNLAMRSGASLADNDAVNYGYVRGLTLYGQAVTDPQTFTNAWGSAGTAVNGNRPYVFSLSTLAATTGEMLVVTDSENRTYVPTTTVPAAAGQFFLLNTSVSPKTVTVYLTTGITPSGTLTVRNFGTSRSVSAATAGAAVLGLVQVPTTSGLNVDVSGNITLNVGSSTQRGGYKVGTTLGLTSTDVLNVNLTDVINSNSSTTAASGFAVNALRQASMLIDGTIQMTGKLRTAAATTAIASLSIPSSAATLGTLVSGDLWNLNDVLQFRTSSATKQIAYRDAATTSALGLVQISTGNDSGLSITGPGVLSIAAASSTALGGIKIGTGLELSSGSTIVRLSSLLNSTLTDTAATSSAIKTVNDYAVGVQANLTATNSSLATTNSNVTTAQTTANAALPKAGGTMAGLLTLVTSTAAVTPLRFIAGSAPTSPLEGAVWYQGSTLKMQTASGEKILAFTDSTLTGSAASAAKWTTGMNLALGGDLSGNITFDGSAGVTLNATIVNNSVALGADTTGDYVATVSAGDGITVSGTGETAAVTVTNSDRGSLQNIFKRIAGGSTEVSANSNNALLTISGGSGITVTGDNATKVINIASSLTLPNSFSIITVSGQPNVVADGTADTLNLAVGSGITITTNATTDTLTLNNTGVLSIAGSSDQITASIATGAVSLTLPQSIGTSSAVQFGSATLGSITVGSTTIGSSAGLTLAPTSAATAVTGSLTVSTTLGVTGTSAFTGAVTLGSTLALSSAASTIAFGGTAAAATTSINRAGSATGVNQIGDIILRTPASGKAYLVANATNTTVTTANDAIVTKGVMDTAISGLGSTYMSTAGALATTNQTLGAGSGSFIVQTGTPTPASRLTIVNSGAATFSGALAVTGATTLSSTLVVSGATTLSSTLVVSGLVTASTVPTDGNHLTNKTYVDAQDLTAPFAYERTLAKLQRDRTVDSLGVIPMINGTNNTIDLSTIAIGVPTVVKYNYNGNSGNVTCTLFLAVEGTESAYLLFKGVSGSGVITTATALSNEVTATPTVDLTNNTAPPAVVPNNPTLLSGAGNIQLYTRTTSSTSTRVGFTILRVS
jgi:hypothetical protein